MANMAVNSPYVWQGGTLVNAGWLVRIEVEYNPGFQPVAGLHMQRSSLLAHSVQKVFASRLLDWRFQGRNVIRELTELPNEVGNQASSLRQAGVPAWPSALQVQST